MIFSKEKFQGMDFRKHSKRFLLVKFEIAIKFGKDFPFGAMPNLVVFF